MTGSEFAVVRKSRLKVSQAELALMMATPKRTIQELEGKGEEEIRGVYGVCLGLLVERDQWVMQGITSRLQQKVERDFPNGIISQPDLEGDLDE